MSLDPLHHPVNQEGEADYCGDEDGADEQVDKAESLVWSDVTAL